jgi:hypothetical protein
MWYHNGTSGLSYRRMVDPTDTHHGILFRDQNLERHGVCALSGED